MLAGDPKFDLSGYRVYQDLRITSGLPVIQTKSSRLFDISAMTQLLWLPWLSDDVDGWNEPARFLLRVHPLVRAH
jgi:hypothetical protein